MLGAGAHLILPAVPLHTAKLASLVHVLDTLGTEGGPGTCVSPPEDSPTPARRASCLSLHPTQSLAGGPVVGTFKHQVHLVLADTEQP